jgi:hypothetical protein
VYARLRRGTSVYGVDGAIEVSLLRGAAGDEVLLSLWPTLAEAAADPGAEWYEVLGDQSGAGGPAEVAAVVLFGGPLWAPVRFPHPAGTSRALMLWQPERLKQAVVLLGPSPVDFPGPVEADRVDLYQVLSVHAGCPR